METFSGCAGQEAKQDSQVVKSMQVLLEINVESQAAPLLVVEAPVWPSHIFDLPFE